MRKKAFQIILGGMLTLAMATSVMAAPERPECLAGAKPGGGFDLTCRLAANSLLAAKLIDRPMQVTYMPGGVGAVAYNYVIAKHATDGALISAASTGSALLIAQGKFGKYDASDVRWLGAVAADYGVLVVAANSPIKSLGELVAAYAKNPNDFPIGGGGAVGSQDWMKAALMVKAAGREPKSMRYVALEGGGAVLTALEGGHIKVASGDAAEMVTHAEAGKVRIIAVLSDTRLPGPLKDVPTAKEQGLDIEWTVWRGYYMGPDVSDADYQWWKEALTALVKTPQFAAERDARGLFPFMLMGDDFTARVKADVKRFKALAAEAGL